MSKELEALEIIRNVEVEIENNHDTAVKVFNLTNEYDDCFKIIEKAIKDYEDLKERMGITDVVKEDFIKLWKEHKALEIIKSIPMKIHFDEEENIGIILVEVVKDLKTKETNLIILGYVKGKENCDLLKEVFGNE